MTAIHAHESSDNLPDNLANSLLFTTMTALMHEPVQTESTMRPGNPWPNHDATSHGAKSPGSVL